jgi:adenine phosphoribosyltransferase
MSDLVADVKRAIRDVPDFPEPGILFKDITPILSDHVLFGRVNEWMAAQWRHHGVTVIVGMEARGFIFGTPLVRELEAGFAPARKKGKLPHATRGVEYALEYGTATLELHVDAVGPGDQVLIVDDLLATGGTAVATVELVRALGAEVVGCCFLVELDFLEGRARLDVPVTSLAHF